MTSESSQMPGASGLQNEQGTDAFDGASGGRELPPVGGRVRLELNAVLTVSGWLRVRWGALHFKPATDARLVGRGAFSIALDWIIGIERRDGNRRVVIRTAREELVFRGEGAQRAWVALTALKECPPSLPGPWPELFEQDPRAERDTEGLYGISARGCGFADTTGVLGRVTSFWAPYDALQQVRSGSGGAELVTSDRTYTLPGSGAGAFIGALPKAWLASLPALIAADGAWTVRAVMFYEAGFRFGALALNPAGIVFDGLDGTRFVVARRGINVRPQVDPRDATHLALEIGTELRGFLVEDPAACVSVLEVICYAPDWGAPDDETAERVLSERDGQKISGMVKSVLVIHHGAVVANAHDLVLTPGGSQMRFPASFPSLPPITPFPATLEVDGKRGRFMVPGVVASVRPVDRNKEPLPGMAVKYSVAFKFTGGVADRNRREFFRLDVKEAGGSLFTIEDGQSELLDANVRLLNLSRRGCLLRVAQAPLPGVEVLYATRIGEDEVSIFGTVAHVTMDKEGASVGISYAEGSLKEGARVYHDRELEFLRKRSDSE